MNAASVVLGALLAFQGAYGQEPATGTISGQVLSVSTGMPLPKARVTATRRGGRRTAFGARIGPDGQFVIDRLEPGNYILEAACLGYVRQRYPSGAGSSITVTASQQIRNVEFKLTPHAVISGRVLNEAGRPFAGVIVQPMQFRFDQGTGRRELVEIEVEGGGETNDLGQFRIWGLAPGRYYLQAQYEQQGLRGGSQDGGQARPGREEYAPQYYPGVQDPRAAAPIEALAGLEVSGVVLNMARTHVYSIRGRVVGADGRPTRGGTVEIESRDTGSYTSSDARRAGPSAGVFEFQGVVPGAYRITATAENRLGNYAAAQDVDVTSHDIADLTLTLVPGIDLTGTAIVEDRPDWKWQSATVTLLGSGGRFNLRQAFARIAASGRFILGQTAIGRYRMVASAGPGTYLKAARLGSIDIVESEFELTPAAAGSRIELVFSAKPGAISGTVQDQDGKPFESATVLLVPETDGSTPLEVATATTSSNGGFHVQNLRPGDYNAIALDDVEYGEWFDPGFLQRYADRFTAVRAAEGSRETVNLTLVRAER